VSFDLADDTALPVWYTAAAGTRGDDVNRPLLVWLLLGAIWGSTWLFIKLGLEDLPPLTFAGVRFLVASASLLVLLWVRKRPMPRSLGDWGLAVGTGVLTFSISYGLVFWGEDHISSGLTSVLYTTQPLFGLLAARALLPDEPLTLRRLGGVLLGIGGVVLIFSRQLGAEDPLALWGTAAVIASALASAFSAVVLKRWGTHLDPLWLATVQMVSGFIPLLVVGIPLEGSPLRLHWTGMAWGALFYLALMGSALPFVLYYWLLKRMSVTKIQLLPLFCTVLAVLLGGLVLHEELSWRTALGAVGVLVGLCLVTWRGRGAPVRSPVQPKARSAQRE
jgi:drug/metabolite transporter (DMT)-like permease